MYDVGNISLAQSKNKNIVCYIIPFLILSLIINDIVILLIFIFIIDAASPAAPSAAGSAPRVLTAADYTPASSSATASESAGSEGG